MNKIYLKTIPGVIMMLLMMMSSCNLDRLPSNAIPEHMSLKTVEHVKFWEAGFMAGLRTVQKGIFENLQDVQADQLNASIGFANNMVDAYAWESFKAANEDLGSVWHAYYNRIKNINYALPRFSQIPAKTAEDRAIIDRATGVGHFLRAYYYFNLSIRYAKPYNAETAETDLGVPLVLIYDQYGMPARATNKAVYEHILNVDIKEAKRLLGSMDGRPMASNITKDAVLALEARIKLYMSDWKGALAASEALISSGTYTLSTPMEESFRLMWHQSLSTEEILQLQIQRPDELPNTSNYYGATTVYEQEHGLRNNPDYLPSQWMVNLYSDADIRKKVYFEKQNCFYQGETYLLNVISKFKGDVDFATLIGSVYSVWGGYVPNSLTNPKVFRIAEQYLIAAEAAYMSGDADHAVKYLNQLRYSRRLGRVNATGNKLLREIRDERTRELAFEGFRLWDLRRWNMPMKRHSPQTLSGGATPFLYNGAGLDLEIPAGHDKFVWAIPSNDIKTNPNIANQQNPGWGL